MNPLNTNSVKKLVLKNTLKTHYSVSALIDLIVKQVKEIPDYLKLKQDIELILMICTMIETICTDSEVSIDKLEAIRGVYSPVFEMTTDDHLVSEIEITIAEMETYQESFNTAKTHLKELKKC